MIVKKGVVKVIGSSYGEELVDVCCIGTGVNSIVYTGHSEGNESGKVYTNLGIDMTDVNIQRIVLNQYVMGEPTVTWITPLTEVSDSLDDTYPIGTIYTTVNPNFNPSVELGGTWQKYDESNKIEWLRTA